jgi:hypothetical protein
MNLKSWSKKKDILTIDDKEAEKSFYQKTTDILLRNIAWFFIISGFLIIFFSMWKKLDVQFADVSQKIGLTILTSGVFAAVLKSFQFIGVFKEEIENVILGSKFIEKRNDLPILWKKISQAVYKQKFPEISDSLQEIILNSYFPTSHPFYYEDFVITINIEEVTPDMIIKFTQSYKMKVVLAEGVDEVVMSHVFSVDKFDGMQEYKNEKEYYKVDGKDILNEIDKECTEDDFEICHSYSTKITGKKSFEIESRERREYCIKEDNSKIFRVNSITKEMDISVSYPENLTVVFFSIGTVEKFIKKHTEHKNHISRVHKHSLILPKQGFGLTFALKS